MHHRVHGQSEVHNILLLGGAGVGRIFPSGSDSELPSCMFYLGSHTMGNLCSRMSLQQVLF